MVNKEFALMTWECFDKRLTVDETCSHLDIDDSRTIERLRAEIKGFREAKSDQQLSRITGWVEKTIKIHRMWWSDYERSKYPWSRPKHLEALAESAQKLRSRIINPELRQRPFTQNKSIWYWNDFDWRIAPDYWFTMMTPLLDFIDAWIPNAENLLSHLSSSNFMAHYRELEDGTRKLQVRLNEMTSRLKEEDPSYGDKLEEFQETLGIYFVGNFTPDEIPPKDTIDALVQGISHLGNFMADTIESFENSYLDLDKHCNQLEKLLQQVYDDLDPDIVNFEIEIGKCLRCT